MLTLYKRPNAYLTGNETPVKCPACGCFIDLSQSSDCPECGTSDEDIGYFNEDGLSPEEELTF